MERAMTDNKNKDSLEQYNRMMELQDDRRCKTWFAWANFMVIVNGGALVAILTTQTTEKFKVEFFLFLIGLVAILFAKTIDLVNLQNMISLYFSGRDKLRYSCNSCPVADFDKIYEKALEEPLNYYNKNSNPVYVLSFLAFAACIIGIATGTLNQLSECCQCTVYVIDGGIVIFLFIYYRYLKNCCNTDI